MSVVLRDHHIHTRRYDFRPLLHQQDMHQLARPNHAIVLLPTCLQLNQSALAKISSQANLSRLEQGKTQVSSAKLSKIALTLDFDLVALRQALQDGTSPANVMTKASKDLENFIA